MRCSITAAITALLTVIAIRSVAGQEADYRLSGVVFAGEGKSIAVIERVTGESVSVRAGDVFDDGRVVEIGERHVRLSFPASELILQIRGDATADVSSYAANRRNGLEADPGTENMRKIENSRLFFEALDEITSQEPAEDAVEEESPGRALGRRLGPLLGLPEGVAVRRITGHEFRSSGEGLGAIHELLEQSTTVRLELERNGELMPPLYIFPAAQR